MTSHSLEFSFFDAFADAVSELRRQVLGLFSTSDFAPRPAGILYDDIAALPDHLLRDIGIEPHELGGEASEFRTQVDASGFRQSAFTVDSHDIRALLAAELHRRP